MIKKKSKSGISKVKQMSKQEFKEGLSEIIIIFNILAVKSVTGFCTFYNSTRYLRTNQVPHLT